jgi:glycosyltransferase involved in cell wall biosynthesis
LPKLLFLSESCLFDRSSGAALSMRNVLTSLSNAGWEVRAATLNGCDGDQEYPLKKYDPVLDPAQYAGQTVSIDDGLVVHEIMLAQSTIIKKLRPWDLLAYSEMVNARLRSFRPDIVLTYCSPVLYPLLASAQRQGAQTIFYVANPALVRQPDIKMPYVDRIVAPSKWLADLCASVLKKPVKVIRPIVKLSIDGQQNLSPDRIASRIERYVTLINPSPQKGGLFFINLVAQATAIAPNIKFRAVESRWKRENWENLGVPSHVLDKIDWYPHTDDMAKVYSDAAILLVPSLWEEAFGRVIIEGLLAGLPVLAMRNCGMPEALGDGGILFDLPQYLANNHVAPPEKADLQNWLQCIKALQENDDLYTQAVNLALRESERFSPEQHSQEMVASFEEMLHSAIPSISGGNRATLDALQHYRKTINSKRIEINAKIEENAHIETNTHSDMLYLPLLQISLAQPALKNALTALNAKDWHKARFILEQYLRWVPEDMVALSLLADVASAQEHDSEVRHLLEDLIALAPGFMEVQQRLIKHLRQTNNASAALNYSGALLATAPENPRYQSLHAGILIVANQFVEAIALYQVYFDQCSGSADDWMQYALAMKTLGRQQEGVAAYRKAIEISPNNGGAWYGLSNMKLTVFGVKDIDCMESLVTDDSLKDDDRLNLHFTLGKAYEDAKTYSVSFHHYAKANTLRRKHINYDVELIENYVEKAKEIFTRSFFEERDGYGKQATDPIFVVGMHRAGSTLIEQILSSHSQIEGTRELPHLSSLGRYFGGLSQHRQGPELSADLIGDLRGEEYTRLGQMYLGLSRAERLTESPYFVDKMPANWMFLGIIHLMLPNAKIIDIRRQPMAAGFALFKMNFGRNVDYSYDQEDIARYYLAYADLMTHFDNVMPGRVHHIQYETLVADTDNEIKRLIKYCGLPFEDQCLRYWETERAIQTPSSEQVRQPIFKGAVDQWMHYAQWLEPMQKAFGDLVMTDGVPPNKALLTRA